MTDHKTNARTWRINDEAKENERKRVREVGREEKRKLDERGTWEETTGEECRHLSSGKTINKWTRTLSGRSDFDSSTSSAPRLNFNAAVSLIGFLIGTIRATLILCPHDLALCLLLLLFATTPRLLPPTLRHRFSLGGAFFTADYVCGYRSFLSLSLPLPRPSRGQFSFVVYGRALKCSTFFPLWLNNLQTPYFSLPLSPRNVYTVSSINDWMKIKRVWKSCLGDLKTKN